MDHSLKSPEKLRRLAQELVTASETFERYVPRKPAGDAPAGLDLLGQLGEVAHQSLHPPLPAPPPPLPPEPRYGSNREEFHGVLSQHEGLTDALLEFHRRTQPAAYRPRPTLEASANGEISLSPAPTGSPRAPHQFSATKLPQVQAVPKQQPILSGSNLFSRRRTAVLRPSSRD